MDSMLTLFLGSYALLLGSSALACRELESFLAGTPSIADSHALDRYKRIARHNMYGALAQIPLGVAGLVASAGVVSRHGLRGFAGVLLANGLLFLAARRTKAFEARARTLPAAAGELERQHRRIAEVWVKRALPDF